jgi:dipeptidyl aminopeptidase/acylaminoacyl peptidase
MFVVPLPARISRARGVLGAAVALTLLAPGSASAQSAANGASWDPQAILREETFVKPPAVVERIVTAPRVDIAFENPSPDRRWFLRTSGPDRGDIRDYGKAHLWIGGLQVDTAANRARSLTTSTTRALTLVDPRSGTTRTLDAPRGAQSISAPAWSPTGTHVAFIANFERASHAFVAEVASGRVTQVSRTPLLATMVTSLTWTADGRQLLAVLVPASRGAVPVRGDNGIENGPQVRLTGSRAVPQPVHFSLLEGPHDKAMLEHYTIGQLALLDVRSRAERRIGAPQLFRSVDVSPDAQQVRITRVTTPYSYLVPVSSFGTVQEVWDLAGTPLVTLATTPLREANPRTAGPGAGNAAANDSSRRNVQWNPVGTGLVYLQNIVSNGTNGGRGTTGVRYVHWRAPYGPNDTATLFTGSTQFTGLAYSRDGGTMFVNDSGAVIAVRVADPGQRFRLPRGVSLALGGGNGFGGGGRGGAAAADTSDNGRLLTATGALGEVRVVLAGDGKGVYVSGVRTPGAKWHEQAPRPWMDRLDITSGARTRVFESADGGYDSFVAALDDDLAQYIFTRESRTTIQDAWLRDVASGTTRKLTSNVDVAPEVTGAVFKRFQVVRPRDGYRFWTEVTLPSDWRPGTRLPGVIWFYPREYASLVDYERSRFATNIAQFPAVPAARPATATSLWVAGGYAFIQPDIPIFGDAGRMNDNYTRDLEENLDAVLDAMVDSGFVDRHRMGIGGHSYGAFSTVNAMTLVPYFKAGIAGDGMYNRSLTPFGFQSERRNFFEAQDTYLDMSPFFRADKLAGALLMYHATEDQNVGTAPMSSIRMYQALQGLGKNAALYMYPYEDHSVATYQSDLDMWARWLAWFDVHVKNATLGGTTPDVVP